jgi:serine/threonine protein kinase
MMSNAKESEAAFRLDLGSYRGELSPEYDDPLFIEAISHPEELWTRPGIESLLDRRNRVGSVRILFSSGLFRDIVVKEFSSRGIARLKSLFQDSKAERAWGGALALEERRLGTASPAGYLEKRKRGFVDRSFFFAARVDGAEEIRGLFRSLQAAELGPLLSALAAFLSQCHDRGILHRDLSDGNVLVKKDDSGGILFYLLDTNRIRLRKRLGGFRRSKNLIRLGVPPEFQRHFLRAYFGDQPLPKAYWFWYRINKAVFANTMRLKKRLRLRQIARFLRIQ